VALLREKGNIITTAMMRTCARLFFGMGKALFSFYDAEMNWDNKINKFPSCCMPFFAAFLFAPRDEKGAEASCFLAFCVV
jgi:hypothetical protein